MAVTVNRIDVCDAGRETVSFDPAVDFYCYHVLTFDCFHLTADFQVDGSCYCYGYDDANHREAVMNSVAYDLSGVVVHLVNNFRAVLGLDASPMEMWVF